MGDFGDSFIRFSKKAWGSMGGANRALSSRLDANSAKKDTTTAGINLSKDNDFTIPLKTRNDKTIWTRPDNLAELKKAAQSQLRDLELDNPISPIEAVQNGEVVGEIDPQEILSH